MSFEKTLAKRLHSVMLEQVETSSAEWKDVRSPNYDRFYAESCLFNTIGPLTDNPRWVKDWGYKLGGVQPPPEFSPGGPAPRWTKDEVFIAFCGDPNIPNFFDSDNPRGPAYPKKYGGSPLYRRAKRIAMQKNPKGRLNRDLVMDLYANGTVALTRLMEPGADQGRSPFISFAISNITGAMTGGVGGDKRTDRLLSGHSKMFIDPSGNDKNRLPTLVNVKNAGESDEQFRARQEKAAAARDEASRTWREIDIYGIPSILKMTDPEQLRAAASVVKGDYRYQAVGDQSADNPFGNYSADYYNIVNELASAYATNDPARITDSKNDLKALLKKAETNATMILGAHTGIDTAITDPSRVSAPKISSISGVTSPEGEQGEMQLAAKPEETDEPISEMFNHILSLGLSFDMSKFAKVGRFQDIATRLGVGSSWGNRFTSNEYRFLLRQLGMNAFLKYPGKGVLRKNSSVPRESTGWWSPGEDPEIELIPAKPISPDKPVSGEPGPLEESEGSRGLWKSFWVREMEGASSSYLDDDASSEEATPAAKPKAVGPQSIAHEMTMEAMEFQKLGIPIDKNRAVGVTKDTSISKQAVSNTLKRALDKFRLIAAIEQESLVQEEGLHVVTADGELVMEHITDKIDRRIMVESFGKAIAIANRVSAKLIAEDLKDRVIVR